MPLLQRKRVILAKIESSYGVDPTPTGAANALLVRNLNVTPQDADFADRNLVRPYLGRSEQLPAAIRGTLDFEVEMAGAGTAGVAPGYGPLLRACGFSEALLAAALTGTAQAGSTNTITLAASGTSSTDDAYIGMGIAITGGTGSGQSSVITDYNGTTKIATVLNAWTTPPSGTSTYSIGANAAYRPVSTAFESVTIYFNVDGVLHKMTGARGSVSVSVKVKDIPVLKFNFTGLYNAVTDAAAPTPVYTAFQTPLTVSNVNTTPFLLGGFAAVMSELSVDVSNQIVHRTLVGGSEQVLITDRQAQGNITVEATTVAAKDWWTLAKNATLSSLDVVHGTASGNKVRVTSPNVQLTKPTYQDMDGVAMLAMGANFVPTLATGGNDELTLSVF
jgi:hypothetical protein